MRKRQLTPIGIQIKKRIIELGITQRELAEAIGTSECYLNFILYGERTGKKYIEPIKEFLKLDTEIFKISA